MVVTIFCSILRGPTFHSHDSTARNLLRINLLAPEICELHPIYSFRNWFLFGEYWTCQGPVPFSLSGDQTR